MFARRYVPYVMFPVALIIGTIGYNIERAVRDVKTPSPGGSLDEKRQDRILNEMSENPVQVDSLKSHKFMPGSVFTKNISPSLQSLHDNKPQ